ncbi:MAG TPA: hypothetical protein PLL69_01390, partial [Gemmatimonadales bacterium]|nr:hypothetical protein [Gemmatimonadales bacterium]
MTYSEYRDLLMGHSADGREVFYTFCEDSKAGGPRPCGQSAPGGNVQVTADGCLGSLPAEGGSRTFALCGSPVQDADSAKIFHTGTRLADGSLLFVYSTRRQPFESYASNGKLYIQRPGQHDWTVLVEYPYMILDSAIPYRLLAAGPGRV